MTPWTLDNDHMYMANVHLSTMHCCFLKLLENNLYSLTPYP